MTAQTASHGQRVPCARLVHRAFTVLLCLLLLCGPLHPGPTLTEASLIATSKIQYCQRDGSVDATEPAGCTRKMVVTLTIDSGQLSGVEDVVFISSAADETDSTGTSAPLQFEALRLSTSRTPVVYRYPVVYTHNYNAKPYEVNIGGTLLSQCNADFNANTATCGISTDANNKPVPYSQGFCCDCGACATLGLCEADWRASNACNLFQTYTTASCLRFAELWYSGYTVGTMRTSYDITLTFSTNRTSLVNVNETSRVAAELHLSPQTPEDSSTSPSVLARLIGDFASSEQPWDFTSHMLFVPSMPPTHARVAAGVSEYMLLPTTAVTTDGRTCNKVGVSYEAFASQGNACRLAKGSCLAAQLEDYRTADVAAIAAGRSPQFLVSAYGNFSIERVSSTTSNTPSPYLAYQATAAGTSMVTITINADDLQFVVSVSPGRLVSVKMSSDTIRASSTDGVLMVALMNTGTVSSRYVVAVPTCTEGILPITAQTVFLAPQEQRELNFSVLVQDVNMSTSNAYCNVTLRNQNGIVDSNAVGFKVNSTTMDNGSQGGSGGNDGGTHEDGTSNSTCSRCGFVDIKCSFDHLCVGVMVGQLATLLGILVALFVLFKLRHCLCCCLSCSGGGGRRRHSPRRHRRRDTCDGAHRTAPPSGALVRADTTKPAAALPPASYYYPTEPFTTGLYAGGPRVEMSHEPFDHGDLLYTVQAPSPAGPFQAPAPSPSTAWRELNTYTFPARPLPEAVGYDDGPEVAWYSPEDGPYGYVSTAGYERPMRDGGPRRHRRGTSGSDARQPLPRPLSLDGLSTNSASP